MSDVQVSHGIVIGASGARYYQETGQTVRDLVNVGDVVKANYHSDKINNGKRIVVKIVPITECTCNNSSCANRVGANHPIADKPGNDCFQLKCWTIVYIESNRTNVRETGKYRDAELNWLNEYVAIDGEIISMRFTNKDKVEVVEHTTVKISTPKQSFVQLELM